MSTSAIWMVRICWMPMPIDPRLPRSRAEVADRIMIKITSEAVGIYSPAEQLAVVKAVRPHTPSLVLREPHPTAFADLLAWMRREEALPQIISMSLRRRSA